MKNAIAVILFSALSFGCTDASVKKYHTAPKAVVVAKQKLVGARTFTLDERKALESINDFERPLIRARFSRLDLLRKHVPKQPSYLDRGRRESGKLVSSWRLVVPPAVLERTWEEGA